MNRLESHSSMLRVEMNGWKTKNHGKTKTKQLWYDHFISFIFLSSYIHSTNIQSFFFLRSKRSLGNCSNTTSNKKILALLRYVWFHHNSYLFSSLCICHRISITMYTKHLIVTNRAITLRFWHWGNFWKMSNGCELELLKSSKVKRKWSSFFRQSKLPGWKRRFNSSSVQSVSTLQSPELGEYDQFIFSFFEKKKLMRKMIQEKFHISFQYAYGNFWKGIAPWKRSKLECIDWILQTK